MLIESLPTHDNALHDIRLRFSAEGLHVSGILYVVIYILAGIAGALFRGVIASYILGGGHALLIGVKIPTTSMLYSCKIPALNSRKCIIRV